MQKLQLDYFVQNNIFRDQNLRFWLMARGNNISQSYRSIIGNWFHYVNRPFHSQKIPILFSKPICAVAIKGKITKNTIDFQGGRSLTNYFSNSWNTRRGFAQYRSSQQQGSPPPAASEPPPNTSWIKWIMGIVMSVILPSLSRKWSQFLQLKHEVDTVVETADEIVDSIEVVAEKIEEVAEEIAEDLPQGGKFRNAVDIVEDVAKKVAKDAHTAGEFLDKVEDIEEKMEEIDKHQG